MTACLCPQRMRRVDERARSERAATLAARLDDAASALIAVIADTQPERWRHVPAPGEWAIGKDAEHVIEAAGYHQWIVRLTIGQKVSSRRPVLERTRLITDLSPQQAVEQLRRRTDEGAELILGLTDEQLNLPTRPPRARSQSTRGDDRAGPDRSLRRPSRRHRGKEPTVRPAETAARPQTPCSAGIRPLLMAASRAAWSRSFWSA